MSKKSYLLPLMLLLICRTTTSHAQENAISLSNFTVKNQLPPGISEWGNIPGTLLLVAQNNSWGDRPVKLLIAIKKGDNKICGIADGIALDYFKTGSFQTKDLLAALGNCEALPPGDYTLCARFRGMSDNRQWVDISTQVCKPFTVGGGNADAQKYQRPTLVAPANNKVFTEKEANTPLTLRCTPVVPKPQEPVIYHYRIWQITAGQTPIQAMNGSQPVIEKEVENLTQINIASGLFPCSSNCQFVWTVQATNREGKPYGENNGVSEPSYFKISIIGIPPPSRICNSCESIVWNAGTATQTLQGSSINIIQPFNPTGYGSIVAAKAEITAFERYVGDSCMSCNKDWNQWGNFTSGTYSGITGTLGSAMPPLTGNTHHSMYWTTNAAGSFNLNVTTPTLSNLSCCCDRVIVTIRYTYTFKLNSICIVCSQVKTYEVKKGNCPVRPTPHPIDISPIKNPN